MKKFISLVFFLTFSAQSVAQRIPVKVIAWDKMDAIKDKNDGIGDDDIYTIQEPKITATFLSPEKRYSINNLSDYDLTTAAIFANPKFEINFKIYIVSDKIEKEYSVDEIWITNGYRKSLPIWQNNSRIKDCRLYCNDKLVGDFQCVDTYKRQIVDLTKFNLACFANKKLELKVVVKSIYPGKVTPNDVAISEMRFEGTRVF